MPISQILGDRHRNRVWYGYRQDGVEREMWGRARGISQWQHRDGHTHVVILGEECCDASFFVQAGGLVVECDTIVDLRVLETPVYEMCRQLWTRAEGDGIWLVDEWSVPLVLEPWNEDTAWIWMKAR